MTLKNYNIILNLHTRGSSELEIDEINELKNNHLIINNTEYHASQIIEISNIIIGVGTSVLLECITKGKFYYLSYLRSIKLFLRIFMKINYQNQILKLLKF